MENYTKTLDKVYDSVSGVKRQIKHFNKLKPILSNISYYSLSPENQKKYSAVLRHADEIMQNPDDSRYSNLVCDLAREILKKPGGEMCDVCGLTYDPAEIMHVCDYTYDKENPYANKSICSVCRIRRTFIMCDRCGHMAHPYALFRLAPRFSINPDDDPEDSIRDNYYNYYASYVIKDASDYDNPIIHRIFNDFFTDSQIETLKEHYREIICYNCFKDLGLETKYLYPSSQRCWLGMKTGRKIAFRSSEDGQSYTAIRNNLLRTAKHVLRDIDTYSSTVPRTVENSSNSVPPAKAIKMISDHFDKKLFYLFNKLYSRVNGTKREYTGNYRKMNLEDLNDSGIVFENSSSTNKKHHDILIMFPVKRVVSTDAAESIVSQGVETGYAVCPFNNSTEWEVVDKNGNSKKYSIVTNMENLSVELEDDVLTIAFEYLIDAEKIS